MTASRILLIFFLIVSKFCFGQSAVYHPLPDSNAYWTETSFWLYPGPPITPVYATYTVFMEGDTVINSQVYTKLYENGAYGAFGPQIFYTHVYKGAFRQDIAAKKAFIVFPSGSTESVLYDFNLNVGDTINFNVPSNVVLDIDSVLVGGAWHKRFLLEDLGWGGTGLIDTNYALIEGVGSTLGLLQPIVTPFENGSHLECFSHINVSYPPNTNCNFHTSITEVPDPNSFNVYPNPASDFILIPPVRTSRFEIINATGEVVLARNESFDKNTSSLIDISDLRSGLYIIRTENRIGRFLKL